MAIIPIAWNSNNTKVLWTYTRHGLFIKFFHNLTNENIEIEKVQINPKLLKEPEDVQDFILELKCSFTNDKIDIDYTLESLCQYFAFNIEKVKVKNNVYFNSMGRTKQIPEQFINDDIINIETINNRNLSNNIFGDGKVNTRLKKMTSISEMDIRNIYLNGNYSFILKDGEDWNCTKTILLLLLESKFIPPTKLPENKIIFQMDNVEYGGSQQKKNKRAITRINTLYNKRFKDKHDGIIIEYKQKENPNDTNKLKLTIQGEEMYNLITEMYNKYNQ